MDPWKMKFLLETFGNHPFSGAFAVSFKEGFRGMILQNPRLDVFRQPEKRAHSQTCYGGWGGVDPLDPVQTQRKLYL